MNHLHAFVLLPFLAIGCAINPAAIEVTQKSDKALLVLQVDSEMLPESVIQFVKFEKCGHQIDRWSAFGGAGYMMEKRARSGRYLVAQVPPGVYVMTGISQQEKWFLSLNANTISFEAKPGEVLFVGKFDPIPHYRQLQELAKDDPVATGYQTFIYKKDILPVRVDTPNAADIDVLRSHLAAKFPGVSALIRVADVKEDYFISGTDSSLKAQPC